jgi:SAM-dependent methyltransferase
MKKDFAKSYGELEDWHWWFRGRQRVLESILSRRLNGASPKRILSVGCGPAEGLQWLTPYTNAGGTVVGLDVEPLHARSSEGIEFVVGSLEAAPLKDHSFDAVLALDVLEHLDDDSLGLKEVSRLVKPGGLLLITVPALPSIWGGQDLISEHRRRYTKRSLRRLFDAGGLSDYRITYFNTLLFPLAAGLRWSRRLLKKAQQPRSDFDDSKPGPLNEILAMVFSSERFLIDRAPLPFGVSLLATYRTKS